MSDLWNPTKKDKSYLVSGDKKIKLGHLKRSGLVKKCVCKFCGRDVYLKFDGAVFLTGGGRHRCKGIRNND